MNISPARTSAYDILLRIEKDKAFSSVLLPQFEASLEAKDASLCHELVLGCLRRQLYLDRLIEEFTKGKKVDREVRIAIRLGLYQIYFLDRVPEYSAINESVNLVQRAKKTSAKGFVNAVLRKATRERPVLSFADEVERISIETSHPRWLIEKWTKQFGAEETANLATANERAAETAFRFINGNSLGRDLPDGWRRSSHVEGCYLAAPNDRRVVELAASGQVYLQDEASQMVARSTTGAKVLDVCAAPGGKTGIIASRCGKGLLTVAGDLHWHRAEMLKGNLTHQGVRGVSVVQYNAERELPFAEGAFDTVLVDAPCSGTGTIRHNPEIRYSLASTDFAELAVKQLAILKNASKLVRPGGSIIYSTCSLETEENEAVVSEFLRSDAQFAPVPPPVNERFLTPNGYARTFPQRDDMDGFFIAKLDRDS